MKQEEKLYTQTELANKIGVSKGTLSKWISKKNVSPIQEKGNKKLYKKTIVNEYLQSKKQDKKDKKQSFSTIEFLKEEVERQRLEIERLEHKLDEKDAQIGRYADKFAKLADQAQQLNLTDKPQLIENKSNERKIVSTETMNTKQETTEKTSFWKKLFNRE